MAWQPELGCMGSAKGLYSVPVGVPSSVSNSESVSWATKLPPWMGDGVHCSTSEAVMMTFSPGAAMYVMGAFSLPLFAGATRSL